MNFQFSVPSVPRPNMDIFRNARANFLRRQQESEEADLERQAARTAAAAPHETAAQEHAAQQEMQERSPGSTILRRFADIRRPTMPAFMSRRSSRVAPQPRPSSSNYDDDNDARDIESPKTPRFNLGMPNLPSTRLHLPNLTRTWTAGSNGPPTGRPGSTRSHGRRRSRSQSRSRNGSTEALTEPAPAVAADRVRHGRSRRADSEDRRFDGLDPAEIHLARMAEDGRRRRHRDGRSSTDRSSSEREREHRHRHRRRRRDGQASRDGSDRPTPKRFLFCFPWIKSRRVRSQILRCFVSGMFLTLLLAVYLALSITKNINSSEFTVLLILIILFVTIFFCHGLIRLCMLIVRPPAEENRRRQRLPEMYGPGGYAIPRRPIRVVLARDEEAVGIESEASKIQPPAYGLWRESVRVDPNRIYWQRNDEAHESVEEDEPSTRPSSQARGTAAPRPPSYASDEGVDYVVEAQPRSIAPTTDVPLAQHPSEAGRIGRPAEW